MRIFKLKREKPPVVDENARPTLATSRTWGKYKLDLGDFMRKNPTATEQLMIDLLDLHKIKYKFQVHLLGYIVDFYVKESKSVIEVDGGVHKHTIAYDRQRDFALQERGFRIMHVKDDWLVRDPDAVITEIKAYLNNGRKRKCLAKKKRKRQRRKGVTRWQDVPKLSKNHLPKK